jgi:hypothetical protein
VLGLTKLARGKLGIIAIIDSAFADLFFLIQLPPND